MCRKITSHWQPLFSKKMPKWRRRPHFPTKLAAVASFFYKIGGGGKGLVTLLAAVLTWSGYWYTPVRHFVTSAPVDANVFNYYIIGYLKKNVFIFYRFDRKKRISDSDCTVKNM